MTIGSGHKARSDRHEGLALSDGEPRQVHDGVVVRFQEAKFKRFTPQSSLQDVLPFEPRVRPRFRKPVPDAGERECLMEASDQFLFGLGDRIDPEAPFPQVPAA